VHDRVPCGGLSLSSLPPVGLGSPAPLAGPDTADGGLRDWNRRHGPRPKVVDRRQRTASDARGFRGPQRSAWHSIQDRRGRIPEREDRRFRSQSVLGMGVCFPTMAEVADGLNVSVNHVRALIRTGGLSATRKPARSPADRAADVGALDLREVRGEAWLPPRARTVRALGARQRTVRVDDACRPPTRG
jgi:hypothetical protein